MPDKFIPAKKPRKSRAQKIREAREAARRAVRDLTAEDLALLKLHRDRFKGRE
jgi:hypothetical protein